MDERKKAEITRLLANTIGHLTGVERMAGEGVYCIDVIRQIQTVQAALDKVTVMMLKTYLNSCILAVAQSDDISESKQILKEVGSAFRVSKKHNYSIEGEFNTMETKTFGVPNISCGGCTHTIEVRLGAMAGVTRVEADLRTQQVTVVWEEPATWGKIQSLLQEINYPPEGLIQLN